MKRLGIARFPGSPGQGVQLCRISIFSLFTPTAQWLHQNTSANMSANLLMQGIGWSLNERGREIYFAYPKDLEA